MKVINSMLMWVVEHVIFYYLEPVFCLFDFV